MSALEIRFINEPDPRWPHVEFTRNGAKQEAVLKVDGQQVPIKLWSGNPGVISGSKKLEFANSLVLEITYGTGVIGESGGDGGYDIVHDRSKRGAVVRIVETDADGKTEVYVDVAKQSAIIKRSATLVCWIEDFKPRSDHDLCANWNASLRFCPDCGKPNQL